MGVAGLQTMLIRSSLVVAMLGVGCAGPVVCEAPEQQPISCGGGTSLRRNAIEQAYLRPDQWNAKGSAEWGCSFALDRDAGVAVFVPGGELCTQQPAQDNSDDMRVITRRCVPPEGHWTVQGPTNGVRISVDADGGVECL